MSFPWTLIQAQAIDIQNNATVGGNLAVTGTLSSGAITNNSLAVTNNASIGGTTTTNALSVTNNSSVSGTETVNTLAVTNNATIGGTLAVTGRLTGVSSLPTGAANAVLTTDGSGVPSYTTTIPSSGVQGGSNNSSFWTVIATPTWLNRSWGYALANYSIPLQNLNAAATNAVTFAVASTVNLSYGTNTVSQPTYATNSLTINTSGFYCFYVSIMMNGGGVNGTSMNFQIFVNGVTTGNKLYNAVSVSGGVSPISGTIILNLTNGNVVTFRAIRVSGTGVMNTIAADSVVSLSYLNSVGF